MSLVLNRWLGTRAAKPVVFVACLLPVVWLIWAAVFDQLGANPAQALELATGSWTLRMLCVALAITPLRTTFGLSGLARFRRMLGLFVYFYALLHLAAYSWFDMGLEFADIARDVLKRPFVTVGFLAVVLLTPMALTSFNAAMRWLGGQRWQRLHRAVYAVAVLAVVHFFWVRSAKHHFTEVAVYALVLGALLGWRLMRSMRTK